MTNAGLEKLKKLAGLRRMDLRYTTATSGEVNELAKALPECETMFQPTGRVARANPP